MAGQLAQLNAGGAGGITGGSQASGAQTYTLEEIGQPAFSVNFGDPWVALGLLALLALFGVVAFWKLIKSGIRNTVRFMPTVKWTILLVKVPKDSPEKEGQERKAEELLDLLEPLYANLGGLKPQEGMSATWLGRQDHFCLEIARKPDGLIYFYVAVPEELKNFIEEQIHSYYPAANIEETSDYNIFQRGGVTAAAEISLERPSMFPLNSYKKIGGDPMISLTNSLSKLVKDESALIQIVARSAPKSWRAKGVKLAQDMQQGKKLEDALKGSGGGGFWGAVKYILKYVFTNESKKEDKPEEKPEIYKLSPMEEEMVKSLEGKANKAGFEVNIRVIVNAQSQLVAKSSLDGILNSFAQFNGHQYGNGFKFSKPSGGGLDRLVKDSIYRNFNEEKFFVLNTEELTGLYHFPLPRTETPMIVWLQAKSAPAPTNLPSEGLYLGDNIYRGVVTPVFMKRDDRRRHFYLIGMTGTGKSKWMDTLALQDIYNGEGMCFIDPHGDDVDLIISCLPKERADDVIIFDPSDYERPLALNMLEYDPRYPQQKVFAINEMLAIFDKLYDLKATGGPMFEQYMRNALMLIMDDPDSGSTLLEIPKVLADEEFRAYKLSKCKTPVVKDFWTKEAQKAGGEAALANMVPYITSKLTPFIANDLIRPIISQQETSLDFTKAMNEKKIILVKLAKGKIGDINANLLGMIVIGKILMAALGRAEMPEEKRNDFYLYIDEFQNFMTESINVILSEARKYRLCLTVAHQFLGQLTLTGGDEKTKKAIFGNVGTKCCFRIGVEDAKEMAPEFAPVFSEYDLTNCPAYHNFIKLMVDNANPPAFNLRIPYIKNLYKADEAKADLIKQLSRLKYGRDRAIVEAEVASRSGLTEALAGSEDEEEDEEEEDKKDREIDFGSDEDEIIASANLPAVAPAEAEKQIVADNLTGTAEE